MTPLSTINRNAPQIKTGDCVHHRPTGEAWQVAYVRGDKLAWCGYPEGEANLSDCELTIACNDEERMKLLRAMALIPEPDARGRYARAELAGGVQ